MNRIVIKTHEVMKRALDMLDISIDAFASSIGKDRATMYRYLNGEIEVSIEILSTLLDLVYDHGVDIIKVLNIENEEAYYYHATNKEICFPINVYINDGKSNDFGYGFYLGENLRQSSTWGKLGYSTIIYRFKRDKFKELSILDFNTLKPIDWLNYVAINRHKIDEQKYIKLIREYQKLCKKKDIIKGKIADSFSYEILELLYIDKLDIDQAEYSTRIMALGNQLCLKNDDFAKALMPDDVIEYDSVLSQYFLHYSDIIQEKQNKNVDLIIKKIPNPKRLFSVYLKEKYE